MPDQISIRVLGPGDEAVLAQVEEEVFDNPIHAELAAEFLGDPRHHIAVAVKNGVVVGFASGVHYVHPDKPAQLWVNEVGVAPRLQRRGIGKRVMAALLEVGRALGCSEAWVLTDRSNAAARALYLSVGGSDGADEQENADTVGYSFDLR